jgi:thymidylate synthase
MQTIKDIRSYFISALENEEYVEDKTGVKTLDLVGASFLADAPAIFGTPNEEYISREIDWYESQSLNVEDIPGETPAIWKSISSDSGKINSNYGYLINSEENFNQYQKVLRQLLVDRQSRRAVMIYQRPTMHEDFCVDGMSDFICTNAVQYLIRGNKVNAVVQMRSNDVIFGYRNDYAWQLHVLQNLVADINRLGAPSFFLTGDITWQVGSLHVYERHFKFVK